MSDDLVKRLDNLWEMLEEEGFYTKANTVMLARNRIEELEAERDDYAYKLAEANNTYSEMHVALSELNDKLATCEKYRDAYAEMERIATEAVRDLEAKLEKVVKVLETIVDQNGYADDPWGIARTTLAELKADE